MSHSTATVCVQIIENVNEIMIQGYAYQDWIREIPNPQVIFLVYITNRILEIPNPQIITP